MQGVLQFCLLALNDKNRCEMHTEQSAMHYQYYCDCDFYHQHHYYHYHFCHEYLDCDNNAWRKMLKSPSCAVSYMVQSATSVKPWAPDHPTWLIFLGENLHTQWGLTEATKHGSHAAAFTCFIPLSISEVLFILRSLYFIMACEAFSIFFASQ